MYLTVLPRILSFESWIGVHVLSNEFDTCHRNSDVSRLLKSGTLKTEKKEVHNDTTVFGFTISIVIVWGMHSK